jgi:hypothetical protein
MERVFSSKLTFTQTQELGKLLRAARKAVTAMQRVGGCQIELPALAAALEPFEGIAEAPLMTPEQEDARLSVMVGLQLLGVTNAPRSAYENVEGGKDAWDSLVADGLIAKEGIFWKLTQAGYNLVRG